MLEIKKINKKEYLNKSDIENIKFILNNKKSLKPFLNINKCIESLKHDRNLFYRLNDFLKTHSFYMKDNYLLDSIKIEIYCHTLESLQFEVLELKN